MAPVGIASEEGGNACQGERGLHMCCLTSEPLKGPYILSILEQETRITVEQVPCQWDALPILS
jgi:hypothetical protein